MRLLAFLIALVIWFLVTMAVRARLDFRYCRRDEEDHLELTVRAWGGLWQVKSVIPTIQLEWEKGPELEIEHKVGTAAGGRQRVKRHLRIRYWRQRFFRRLWARFPSLLVRLGRIRDRFYRGIHCTALDWRFDVGFRDPAVTAVAAGALWAATGVTLARLYRQVKVDVERPRVVVNPRFQQPGFACDIHCIFNLRIGHIIIAGFNLLRTFRWGTRG